MSKEEQRIVRHKRKPLTTEQIGRLDALRDIPDAKIDFSDLPELDDGFFDRAVQGSVYRLLKQQTTLRLDADILDWFKSNAPNGKGYQTDINAALREYIAGKKKVARKKAG